MTNYTRGRSREYKTMQLLRESGWVCSRSAMSHGPVDVFAAKAGKILLIQVKSGSAKAKRTELDLLRKWAIAFDARAEVWTFKKRGKLEKVLVRAKARAKRTKIGAAISLSDEIGVQRLEVPVVDEPEIAISSAQVVSDLTKILPL